MEVYVVVLMDVLEPNSSVWATQEAANRYAERMCKDARLNGKPFNNVTITKKRVGHIGF